MSNFFDILGKRLTLAPSASTQYGVAGVIAGGAIATIKNFPKIMNKEISLTDATVPTFQQSMGTGISSAIGMSVITIVGFKGVLANAGIMVLASLAKECFDTIKLPIISSGETQKQIHNLQ